MGLMDSINDMLKSPGGATSTQKSDSGGMSPLIMALLGLLAYKAMNRGSSQSQPAPQPRPGGGAGHAGADGGDSDWLGGLGKVLAGGAAGSVLSGGLGELMNRMQQTGHTETAHSWVGTGANRSISPNSLEQALGQDTLEDLSSKTGMPRAQLVQELANHLPTTVDKLTPQGRLPSEGEAQRWA
ncbi:MAG: YidB family protein [Xanthobacteraceae bacterium]